MIRKVGREIGQSVLREVGRATGRIQEQTPLSSDLLESDDEYLVIFDAPGTTAGDVQVRYVDGAIKVRIERFRSFHEGFEMRVPGRGLSLDGEVTLPDDAQIDPATAEATLTDRGTLEVRVPKVDDR